MRLSETLFNSLYYKELQWVRDLKDSFAKNTGHLEFQGALFAFFSIKSRLRNPIQNIYDNSKISGNLCVASPSVAYGSSSPVVMNNNFELIKTIIPKLNIFEQLQILSLLASSIEKNGCANGLGDISLHHEIYLSDPRKTTRDKQKTLIRHPIKKDK